MPAKPRKTRPDTFMLRVPPPRIVRRGDRQSGRLIDPRSTKFDLLQSDPDHALVKSGDVLSLSIPRFDDADVPIAFTLDWLSPENEEQWADLKSSVFRDE